MTGNAVLAVVAVATTAELGSSEAYDDYRPGYVTAYTRSAEGLRADGKEISNIFPFDADGDPVVATHHDNELLEPQVPMDRNGDEVPNRYPQAQQQLDQATGQRYPGPTPEFRPPPGPVRSP